MPARRSKPIIMRTAGLLRKQPTPAEHALWKVLRGGQLGHPFRRQHAIGPFVVDFCAPRCHLVIELDGSQHLDRQIEDQERTDYLVGRGYRVLRFWNHEVERNLDGVVRLIQAALDDS